MPVPGAANGKAGGRIGLAELWKRLRGCNSVGLSSRQLAAMNSFDLDQPSAAQFSWHRAQQRNGQREAVTATHKLEVRSLLMHA